MNVRRLLAVCVVLALVPGSAPGAVAAAPEAPPAAPADPSTDVVGWEDGYWHNESIDVDQSDGLNESEQSALVARSMARVEYLRGADFERSVPIEVIPRSEYANRSGGDTAASAHAAWNDQVWEALFVDGEDSNVNDELNSTLSTSVAGFYSPADDEIKIITDSPDRPVIDNGTLVHELVHALQDQRYNLSSSQYSRPTQDGELAADGVVEGVANYVEDRYAERCGAEWECAATPSQGGPGGGPPNLGILLTVYHPYSDGPAYVSELRERGGWAAVDEAMRDPPVSSEQVIHVTDETPRSISYDDRARNGWRTFPKQGENGSDTVGEASIFVMFWYQARTADADTISVRSIQGTSNRYDTYNYDAPPSAGWANDRVFPYQKSTDNDTDYGYVWVTEWDTERDATEFRRNYLAILRAHDATVRDDGVRVIEDGPFADAFLVVQNGARVTIVNGPTPADVRDIRPDAEATESGGITDLSAPGFGPLVTAGAVVALAVAALARR